jgi:hypothetical protein
MPSDRRRILGLALESLENKKRKLDEEIAEITRELRGGTVALSKASTTAAAPASARRRSRFTREEKLRRSQRMKVYWENWHKKKAKKYKSG